MNVGLQKWKLILQSPKYKSELNEITFLEKNRKFCKHDLVHFLDTARVMYIINLEKSLDISKDIIYATGLLHDIGRAEQYKNGTSHAVAGVEIAKPILYDCGYFQDEVEMIINAISCHRNSEKDLTVLGELLVTADKTVRVCGFCEMYQDCYWDEELKKSSIQY